MAVFLKRALGLPAGPDADFDDVDGAFEADINAIANAGIIQGCLPTLYCPNNSLSRAQTAAFLVQVFDLPAGPDAGFGVTNGHLFEEEINRFAVAGIILGCDGGMNFCPNDKRRAGRWRPSWLGH